MSQPTQKPIVMFDIGAVLLELTYTKFYQEVERLNSVDNFKEKYTELEVADLLGYVPEGAYLPKAKMLIDPSGKMSDADIKELTKLCWGGQIDEMVDLKERLASAGNTIGLLSNIGRYGYPILQKKHPEIFKTFNSDAPKIYSFEVGLVKPNPQIYSLLGAGYGPIVFLDDKETYITAAEPFGWKGIHYTPFIDHGESVRAVSGHTGKGSSTMKTANNLAEVVEALESFGIKL